MIAVVIAVALPGEETQLVLRGDCNQDTSVDLSDAVAALGYLFLGSGASCVDACDMDDSGTVELTDAVRLLNHLFLGAEHLPPPFPECGPDPTQDELECESSICTEVD